MSAEPPSRRAREPRIDRVGLAVLAAGLVVVALVLVVLRTTVERERDHTRSVLVSQNVGREVANARIELREIADRGVAVVPNADDVLQEIEDARGLLAEALGARSAAHGFGRVEDDVIRARMRRLDDAIAEWIGQVRVALRPTGSQAQREAVAAAGDALRRENAAIGALVAERSDDDEARLTALQAGLAAVLVLLFGLLAWQVARRRRSLAERNRELAERVAQRTAQLTASEARIRAVIESTLDAVVVIDGDGVVVEWNPRAEELLGVARDAAVGRRLPPEAVPATLAAVHAERVERWRSTGDPAVFDARIEDVITAPDGRTVPIEVTMAAAGGDGELTISHFVRDITERRRAEAEIEAARDAAERAASAKSAFLATMSHEIRTPMNAIVGMTSLLGDTALSDEQREYVSTIRTSGDALLAVINDVLDFSKIESGNLELEQHPFGLRDVIETALDLLAPQATAKGLDLGYLLETDGSTRLVGDATRLRQVLINFLSNAVKFTESGSVTVHGRLQAAGGDRARLRLEVRDTGIGIPADGLDRLFRSFSQIDASTTRKFGGTGLGLAISKRLVEAMDGRVEVTSAERRGSVFAVDVTLPRLPGADSVTADVPVALKGMRVLVVDDNAVNRQLLTHQLSGWEMEVTAEERPRAALARVRAGERWDVALLDLQMPEMDGLALADRLAQEVDGRLPVVLLSSIGGVDPALARGRLAATLSKPVKPATLRSALVAALVGQEAVSRRVAPEQPPGRAERSLHVLVAEDNAVNQRVAVATLERLGHRADVAGDGIEAIAALMRRQYDLVLMDMQMPNLDGLGATRRIRAELPAERQPRIVAMTANAFAEDREACRAAGMDDFLTKPVERDQLQRVLAGAAATGADGAGAAPRAGPVGEGPIDAAQLEAASGGDASIAATLVELHAEEGAALLAQLREAAARADRDALRAAAHTFKSSSATVGATALSQHCAELEARARAGEVADAAARVEQIAEALDASIEALREPREAT